MLGGSEKLALGAHVPDKPGLLRDESQRDAAVRRLSVDLDVPIAAGGIEALDGGADVRAVIWLTGADRKKRVNLVGIERLALGIERNVRDGAAFELRRCRDFRAVPARGDQRQCSENHGIAAPHLIHAN